MTRTSNPGGFRATLVRFPGSNCDRDCLDGLKRHFDLPVDTVWHTETSLPKTDLVILPGGFSFGDYLRSGCLASHSPIMAEVRTYARGGGAVFGICNGFQILTESHLLPGALLRNASRSFVCRTTPLIPSSKRYLSDLTQPVYKVPVAHGEGRYYIDDNGLKNLEDRDLIAFRYGDDQGRISEDGNPNGSIANVAGVFSENGRILGMMPHPERAMDEPLLGSADGLSIWRAYLAKL